LSNKLAKVIHHPEVVNMQVLCNHCRIQGKIVTYKRYIQAVMRTRFWCEKCKSINPGDINIDLSDSPELDSVPFVPFNIIEWEVPINKA
jgi:hypothetical protein